jgi:hypothetical protein
MGTFDSSISQDHLRILNDFQRHPRMDACCAQFGNGTVFVQDDCFAWCDVEHGKTSDFHDCLTSGSNSSIHGFGCSAEFDGDKSASTAAYNAPKITLSALFCGMLALSVLYI